MKTVFTITCLLFAAPVFAAKNSSFVKEIVAAVNEDLRSFGCVAIPDEVKNQKVFISSSKPKDKIVYRTYPMLYETKSATTADVIEYDKKGMVLLVDGKPAPVEKFLNDPEVMKNAQWVTVTPLGEKLYENGCGFRLVRPVSSGATNLIGKPDWKSVYLTVNLENKLADESPEVQAAVKGKFYKSLSILFEIEKNDKGKWVVSKKEKSRAKFF